MERRCSRLPGQLGLCRRGHRVRNRRKAGRRSRVSLRRRQRRRHLCQPRRFSRRRSGRSSPVPVDSNVIFDRLIDLRRALVDQLRSCACREGQRQLPPDGGPVSGFPAPEPVWGFARSASAVFFYIMEPDFVHRRSGFHGKASKGDRQGRDRFPPARRSELIASGRVRVNGQVVTILASRSIPTRTGSK